MNGPTMRTYLVFEQVGERVPHQAAPPDHYTAIGGQPPQATGLLPFNCVGAVRAASSEDAVRAVIGVTRRVSKFAVVQADVVDFATGLSEAEGERIKLNP